LRPLAGALVFSADAELSGRERWRSDSSAVVTELLRDLTASGSADPQEFIDIGGFVYFSAADEDDGRKTGCSDGTGAGTQQVREIWPGRDSSAPADLTASPANFTSEPPTASRVANGSRAMAASRARNACRIFLATRKVSFLTT
jgi:ELWxxDGT repeat protein